MEYLKKYDKIELKNPDTQMQMRRNELKLEYKNLNLFPNSNL